MPERAISKKRPEKSAELSLQTLLSIFHQWFGAVVMDESEPNSTINLPCLQKLLSITPKYLALDEHFMQHRVDMSVAAKSIQYFQRIRERLSILVGPVLGGERFEDVGDAHDPGLPAHVFSLEAFGVAFAVHPFVVATGVFGDVFEVSRPR